MQSVKRFVYNYFVFLAAEVVLQDAQVVQVGLKIEIFVLKMSRFL